MCWRAYSERHALVLQAVVLGLLCPAHLPLFRFQVCKERLQPRARRCPDSVQQARTHRLLCRAIAAVSATAWPYACFLQPRQRTVAAVADCAPLNGCTRACEVNVLARLPYRIPVLQHIDGCCCCCCCLGCKQNTLHLSSHLQTELLHRMMMA